MRTPSPSRGMTTQTLALKPRNIDVTVNVTLDGNRDATVHNTSSSNALFAATLPASPPIGRRFTFCANNGGGACQLRAQLPAGHVIQQGGAASSAGGAATFPVGTIGGVAIYEYIATNKWFYVGGGGTAPVLT